LVWCLQRSTSSASAFNAFWSSAFWA
jgi:hypothetical protein